MSLARVYSFTQEEMTSFANQVKDMLEEHLDLPQLGDVTIIVTRKGILGRAIDKCFSNGDNDTRMFVVAPVSKKVDEAGKESNK